jgi:hypothetical protein
VEQDRVDDHLKRNVRICEIEYSQGIEWLFLNKYLYIHVYIYILTKLIIRQRFIQQIHISAKIFFRKMSCITESFDNRPNNCGVVSLNYNHITYMYRYSKNST